MNKKIIWAGMETLYFSGSHRLARRFLSGVGAILTFHRVRPPLPDGFQPNRSLEITPLFLDEVLRGLRAADIDIVTLDEVHRRLVERDFSRRFAALTFDDGYRDNRDYAFPILKEYRAPFTLFVPSSFPAGSGDLWWIALERAVARSASIEVTIDGEARSYDCATDAAKEESYEAAYWALRGMGSEIEMRAVIADLCARSGVDTAGICRECCMDWRELAAFAGDRLVTIGAHSDTHLMLAKAPAEVVRAEIRKGAEEIEKRLGVRPLHFAFPVGDPTSAGAREFAIAAELGFRTAATTRPGVLFADHADHLTALPRLSVNGEFQRLRYLDVLLSGAPTALLNRFRRVDAA